MITKNNKKRNRTAAAPALRISKGKKKGNGYTGDIIVKDESGNEVLNAKVKDATYEILNNKGVPKIEWQDGTWESGTWQDGTWYTGTWEDGTWKNGAWKNGWWKDGTWVNGTWENGTWVNGTWENGVWSGGSQFIEGSLKPADKSPKENDSNIISSEPVDFTEIINDILDKNNGVSSDIDKKMTKLNPDKIEEAIEKFNSYYEKFFKYAAEKDVSSSDIMKKYADELKEKTDRMISQIGRIKDKFTSDISSTRESLNEVINKENEVRKQLKEEDKKKGDAEYDENVSACDKIKETIQKYNDSMEKIKKINNDFSELEENLKKISSFNFKKKVNNNKESLSTRRTHEESGSGSSSNGGSLDNSQNFWKKFASARNIHNLICRENKIARKISGFHS